MTVIVDVQVRVVVKGTYDPGEHRSQFTGDPADDSPDVFDIEGYYDEDGQAISEELLPLLHVGEESFEARAMYAARYEYGRALAESKGWEEDHPHREGE